MLYKHELNDSSLKRIEDFNCIMVVDENTFVKSLHAIGLINHVGSSSHGNFNGRGYRFTISVETHNVICSSIIIRDISHAHMHRMVRKYKRCKVQMKDDDSHVDLRFKLKFKKKCLKRLTYYSSRNL